MGQVLNPGGKILSQTAEYALRAVVHLARHAGNDPIQAKDLAAATEVPETYLRKILNELVRGGVLRSTRGKRGGFELAVPAERLTLLAVVGPFDRVTGSRHCILGRAECSDTNPCPMHERWRSTAEQIARFVGETTVADVAVNNQKRRKR